MADRHPLRRHAVVAGIVGLGVAIAVQLGVPESEASEWQQLALQAVNLLGVAGVITRGGEGDATPLADPRDEKGRRLAPASGSTPPPDRAHGETGDGRKAN